MVREDEEKKDKKTNHTGNKMWTHDRLQTAKNTGKWDSIGVGT